MILMMRRNVALLVLPVLPGQEKKMKKLLGKGMEVETRKKLDWSLKKSIEIVGLRSQGLLEVDQEED